MKKYEIIFIVKATLESETVQKTAEQFKSLLNELKAKVLDFKSLGEKKFAYPIKKELNGYYYLIQTEASAETIKEFDRKANINENILRHLIVKMDEE